MLRNLRRSRMVHPTLGFGGGSKAMNGNHARASAAVKKRTLLNDPSSGQRTESRMPRTNFQESLESVSGPGGRLQLCTWGGSAGLGSATPYCWHTEAQRLG